MKRFLTLGILCIFLLIQNVHGQENPPETVKNVDIKKYLGLWYEIAKLPNRFQRNCAANTTAEYRMLQNGQIKVINSCMEENGGRNEEEGIAKIVDYQSNAKLKVSFVSFLGKRMFWGDYWIIGLDEGYQYAVVGTPDRKYGWILSRTPELADETLQEIYQILESKGYNPDQFQFTQQSR